MTLTSRAWWFLVFACGMLVLAALAPFFLEVFLPSVRFSNPSSIAMIALTLLLWFAWEGLTFGYRARVASGRLRIRRSVRDVRGPVKSLWAGRTFQIHVEIENPAGTVFPYLIIEDRIPYGVERVGGESRFEGMLPGKGKISLHYSVYSAAPGSVRFEGLSFRQSDLAGFFFQESFVRVAESYRVLPPLVDARGRAPATKRHNLLPPPGYHRLRRPGTGRELLDLRDYMPGDPPKTIAWKVSARRDRLITKDFESEVPVRCTLFLDTSNSVRVGPTGKNALTRLVEIASAVAQAAGANRDLMGLCVFDEKTARLVRPGRSTRHAADILNWLADAAALVPGIGPSAGSDIVPLAYAFALEVYPELLRPGVNRVPFWLPWLSPRPPYTIRHPTAGDRWYRWLPFFLPLYALAGFAIVFLVVLIFGSISSTLFGLPLTLSLTIVGLLCIGLPMIYVRLPVVTFFPERRQRFRWRKQLAAILSVRYGLAPGGLGRLLEDDDLFNEFLQRFLAEHRVPYALPLYDRRGRYLFASPEKVGVLARALTRAVGRGRDNELFVLLADLVELSDSVTPLVKAVTGALARHHRVIVICPWPPGIPPPQSRRRARYGEPRQADSSNDENALGPPSNGNGQPAENDLLRRTTTARFHRAFYRLRRRFGRLGVPVICAEGGDPPKLILDRLDEVRGFGRQ